MAGNGTLDAICKQLQTYMLTLPDVRDAKDHPIENPLSGVVSMCYTGGGNASQQPPGEKQALHNIIINLSTPRKDVPRDYAKLIPYVDSVPNKLLAQFNTDHWNNLVDTFGNIEDAPMTEWEVAPNVWRIQVIFTVRDVKTHIVLA